MNETRSGSRSRYLAEVYLSHVGDLEAMTSPVRAAARAIRREGTPVRYVRSIFVPEDQTCLLLFDAASLVAVQQVTQRAGLQVTRVVAAMETAVPERWSPR